MLLYIVDKNNKTLCALSSDFDSRNTLNFYNDTWSQFLKTPSTFSFDCYGGHKNSEHVAVGNQVIFKFEDEYHLFLITEIEQKHEDTNEISVYCEHASLSLLNSVVLPSQNDDINLEQALGIVLADTDFQVGNVDFLGFKTLEISGYDTVLSEIEKLAEEYKAELKFRVEFNPAKGITGKYVDAFESVGENKGVRFVVGHNVQDVVKKVNFGTVCTAIIPHNGDAGCGSAECTVAKNGFDKPQGQIYVAVPEEERMAILGDRTNKHVFGVLDCETDDPYTMCQLAWEHLQKVKEPAVEYTFNPALLNRSVHIGDTVKCIDREIDLQLEAKVSELNISFTDSTQDSITLTNYEEVESNISDEIKKLQNRLENIDIESNVIVDSFPPINPNDQTVWVDITDTLQNVNGIISIKTWDEEKQQWVSSIDKETLEQYPTKNEVTNEIGVSHDTLATYIDNELVNREMTVYKQDTTPGTGINGQLWLNTSVNPNAWYKYNGTTNQWELLIVAGIDTDTKNKVDVIEQAQNETTEKVNDANAKVNELYANVETIEGDLTQAKNDILDKASKGELTAVDNRLTNTEIQVNQNTNDISTKVSNITYELDKNALTERIATAESNITQNANEISTKVTQAEIDNAINDLQVGGTNILWNTNFDKSLFNINNGEYWGTSDKALNYIEILEKEYLGKNVVHVNNDTTDDDFDILYQSLYRGQIIKRYIENEQYTFSFYVKGSGTVSTFIYPGMGDNSHDRIVDGVVNGKSHADNYWEWELTNEWTRHTYTFTITDTMGSNREFTNVLFRLHANSEIYISMPQLEKGNKATDFNESIDDINRNVIALGSRITTAESTITQHADLIATKVTSTEVETVVNNVANGLQTQIDENENNINNNTNNLNNVSTRLTTAESSIIQHANEIATKVTQTQVETITNNAINNLQIGSSNILPMNKAVLNESSSNAYTFNGKYEFKLRNIEQYGGIRWYSNEIPLKSSTEYRFSFEYKYESGIVNQLGGHYAENSFTTEQYLLCIDDIGMDNWSWVSTNSFSANIIEHINDGNWHKFVIGFSTVANHDVYLTNNYIQVHPNRGVVNECTIHLRNFQLEEGNKVTAWKPSYLDIEEKVNNLTNRITTAESSIIQQANMIATKVTQTEIDNSINALQIGGRNLFEGSGNLQETHFTRNRMNGTFDSFTDIKVPSGQGVTFTLTSTPEYGPGSSGIYFDGSKCGYIPKMVVGEEYVVSAYVKCSKNVNEARFYSEFLDNHSSISMPTLSTEWQRYVVKGTYNGNTTSRVAISIYYGNLLSSGDVLYISSPQVEKGNKASDWRKAIEDTDNAISTLNDKVTTNTSSITQLSNEIQTKVTSSQVENIVNTAIESLSGDGKNLILYGDCSTDIPRLEDSNVYYKGEAVALNIVDGTLQVTTDNTMSGGYGWYQLTESNVSNGLQNDTYVFSFEYTTNSNISDLKVVFREGQYGTLTEYNVNDLTVLSIKDNFKRVYARHTFTDSSKTSIWFEWTATNSDNTFYLNDLKLERGTEATAFTKNPNELTSVELSALKQRVTIAESTLTQHSNQIALKVDQTEYDTDMNGVTTRLADAESQLVVQGNQIATKVTQTEVDNSINALQIGGRNLLEKTATPTTFFNIASHDAVFTKTEGIFKDGITKTVKFDITQASTSWFYSSYSLGYNTLNILEPSTDYTLSFDVKSNIDRSFTVTLLKGDGTNRISSESNTVSIPANVWAKVVLNITTTAFESTDNQVLYFHGGNKIQIIEYANFKFEKGTKATDWTPAPEDIEEQVSTLGTRISEAESSIIQNANQIETKVSQTTYDLDMGNLTSRMNTAESNITQNANQIATKVSQTDFTALGTRVASNETKIQQNTNNISLKVNQTEFDNMIIGGQNLLIGSKTFNKGDTVDSTFKKVYRYNVSDDHIIENYKGDFSCVEPIQWTGFVVYLDPFLKDGTFKVGDKITMSFNVDNNTTVTANIWYYNMQLDSDGVTRVYELNDNSHSIKDVSANSSVRLSTTITIEQAMFDLVERGGNCRFTIQNTSENQSDGTKVLLYAPKLELGNKGSEWSDNNEKEIVELTTRINNAEIKLEEDSIISTVTNSETFLSVLDDKVSYEDVTNFVTQTDIDNSIENLGLQGTIDSRINDLIADPQSNLNLTYTTQAQLEQTSSSITAGFSMANGLNLLSNSIGYAGLDGWESFHPQNNFAVDEVGAEKIIGLPKAFVLNNTPSTTWTAIQQVGNLKIGHTYTFSAYIKKTSAEGYIQLLIVSNDGNKVLADGNTYGNSRYRITEMSDDYEFVYITFIAEETNSLMRISPESTGAQGYVTGCMLHEGSIPLKWSLKAGENYNNSVQMDISGIKVQQRDSESNVTGYTAITPEEFAGYNKNGTTFEKVFWINEDETTTKKLRATNEITMGSIKIVNVNNDSYSGWAFTTNIDD